MQTSAAITTRLDRRPETEGRRPAIMLFPARDRLALRGAGAELEHFDPHTSGISGIRNTRIIRPFPNLIDHDAALLQPSDIRLQIGHMEPVVVQAGTSIRVGRLNLNEGVTAGLNVGEGRLALGVPDRESFLEAHLLRVELERLI